MTSTERLEEWLHELQEAIVALKLHSNDTTNRLAQVQFLQEKHDRQINGDDDGFSLRDIARIMKRREKIEWLIVAGFVSLIFTQIGVLLFK